MNEMCKHFNGIGTEPGKRCKAGVNYDDHMGRDPVRGILYHLPCWDAAKNRAKLNSPVSPCSQFEEATQQEIDSYSSD